MAVTTPLHPVAAPSGHREAGIAILLDSVWILLVSVFLVKDA